MNVVSIIINGQLISNIIFKLAGSISLYTTSSQNPYFVHMSMSWEMPCLVLGCWLVLVMTQSYLHKYKCHPPYNDNKKSDLQKKKMFSM